MRNPPSGSFIFKKKRYTSALSTDWKASWVPTVHRASMAAYVGALTFHEKEGERWKVEAGYNQVMLVCVCECVHVCACV